MDWIPAGGFVNGYENAPRKVRGRECFFQLKVNVWK